MFKNGEGFSSTGGGGGGSSDKFTSDFVVQLSGGKTLGKYTNGQTVPANGKTAREVILDVAIEYLAPSFSSFSVSGQATTIEVGTTLSGNRTFTWGTNNASNVQANSIAIRNVTANTLIGSGLANDGSEVLGIGSILLNTEGATQSFRGEGVNTQSNAFQSSNFTITSRFNRFYGAVASSPTNSAQVRALPTGEFQTGNSNVFNLNTGTTLTKFVVALPPSRTITSVIDLDNLNANITSSYVLTGTVSVLDAGGTSRVYNIYEMNVGSPYPSNARHQITTA